MRLLSIKSYRLYLLMNPGIDCEVGVAVHDVAGDGHHAAEDVVEGNHGGDAPTRQPYDDQSPAVDSLP